MSAKEKKRYRDRSTGRYSGYPVPDWEEIEARGPPEGYYKQRRYKGEGFFPSQARKVYRTKPQDWYRDWHRDIQIIFVIAMCVITFTICAYIFNAFMDFMTPLVNILGITEGPAAGGGLLTFRNTANAVLALVVSLMVGGGLVVLLFRQNEVDDSPYVDGE